jgi:ABC-type multidrug transport system ATPase subunit
MNDQPLLDVQRVTFAYQRGAPVLHDFSLRLAPGEVVGLLGRNGAGKSTLMHLLMGLLHPQSGTVTLFGADPVREPVAVKRRIGYVPDDLDLPAHLSIDALLRLHRELFGTWDASAANPRGAPKSPGPAVRDSAKFATPEQHWNPPTTQPIAAHDSAPRVSAGLGLRPNRGPGWDLELEAELRQRFRLSGARRVGSLSKGEARQVALTCAMAHRPELLLLDEPGSNIDPAMRREFLEATLSLLKRGDTTVLFSSHHVHDVERIADRVVLLDGGRALLDAPLDTLKEALCLAVLTADGPGARAVALHSDPLCLRVRKRGEALHALLRVAPAQGRAHLRDRHGIDDATCGPAPALEELFVELVGRES